MTGATWEIRQGDCVEEMRKLDDCSIDAVVCDPPYGINFMGAAWDGVAIAEAARADRERRRDLGPDSASRPGRAEPRSSSAFGNAAGEAGAYDFSVKGNHAFQVWCETWAVECLRVLKPGGHLLAFGGTRTYHRLASGIEDAGFEIRDCLAWLFGSGFPKSADIAKAIEGNARLLTSRWFSAPHGTRDADFARALIETDLAPMAAAQEAHAGEGTALKPAWECVVVARKFDPAGERDVIDASLCLLGNRIASLSPANPAVSVSGSNPAEQDAALLASARWSADERASTRDALCAQMDTSQFESAIGTSLSTVSSWRRTLAEFLSPGSTSTTATASSTTTVLRTLNSCLSETTPATIIQALTVPAGPRLSALPVAQAFDAVESSLNATRRLSAIASATEQVRTSPREGGAQPLLDPIVVARKPLVGTVAANVIEHGTGGLNIDGCRIGWPDGPPAIGTPGWGGPAKKLTGAPGVDGPTVERTPPSQLGRWPANVVLDEEAAVMLDEQTGNVGQQGAVSGDEPSSKTNGVFGQYAGRSPAPLRGDKGGSSRFFYVAKASRAERNAGLEGFPEGPSLKIDATSAMARDGRRGSGIAANGHPTVKPIELMRWLVRLVTPPDGRVLDPFTGSGTTGCACVLEGFDFVGLEREAEYVAIAKARIAHVAKHREGFLAPAPKPAEQIVGQLGFDDAEVAA